jgi:nicotinate-nucleotide adenylyltransferase
VSHPLAAARPGPAGAGHPPRRRRIGLFGGSFDPVHAAHLALAQAARHQLGLDELRWMPAGQPWQKARRLTAGDHRRAMVEMVIAGEPGFVLEPCELDQPGPSYTLTSLERLQVGEVAPEQANWFLLIGQDQLAGFCSWRGWREILGRVELAVAARDGGAVQAPGELLDHLATTAASRQATGQGGLPQPPCVIALQPMAHAATTLRARLAAGARAADLAPAELHPAVAAYIDQHGLYRAEPSDAPSGLQGSSG